MEEDGVDVDFGDFTVTIRRASSKASQAARKRAEAPHAKAMRRKELPDAVLEDILVQHIAEGIIADWKGVTGEDGKELKPTVENKVKVLVDLPDFRAEVIAISTDMDVFKDEHDADTVKN